jgi:hypothetical protein
MHTPSRPHVNMQKDGEGLFMEAAKVWGREVQGLSC